MSSGKFAKTVAGASVGTVVAVGLLFGPTIPFAAATGDQPAHADSTTATARPSPSRQFLKMINEARAHPELYPPHGNTAGAAMTACSNGLTYSSALHSTAADHNDYLASQTREWIGVDSNAHRGPNGKLVWEAGEPMDQAGYHSYRAEIVAWGQETRGDALRAWMQDDEASNWGHRNLILNCSVQDAGPAIHNGGSWGHYIHGRHGQPIALLLLGCPRRTAGSGPSGLLVNASTCERRGPAGGSMPQHLRCPFLAAIEQGEVRPDQLSEACGAAVRVEPRCRRVDDTHAGT